MGWCMSNGMGTIPLSFTEINAYIQATLTPLNRSEVIIMRRMSMAYVSELNDRNPNKLAPFMTNKPADIDAKSIVSMFSGIATVKE